MHNYVKIQLILLGTNFFFNETYKLNRLTIQCLNTLHYQPSFHNKAPKIWCNSITHLRPMPDFPIDPALVRSSALLGELLQFSLFLSVDGVGQGSFETLHCIAFFAFSIGISSEVLPNEKESTRFLLGHGLKGLKLGLLIILSGLFGVCSQISLKWNLFSLKNNYV